MKAYKATATAGSETRVFFSNSVRAARLEAQAWVEKRVSPIYAAATPATWGVSVRPARGGFPLCELLMTPFCVSQAGGLEYDGEFRTWFRDLAYWCGHRVL